MNRIAVGVERIAERAFAVVQAIVQGHARKDQQGGDLNQIDGDVDGRGSRHAAVGDVRDAERENDAEADHERRAIDGAVKRVGKKLAGQVSDENRGNADHDAGIEPIIKMAGPTDDEFRDSCEPVGAGLG